MFHLHQELVDSLKNERLVALCTVIVGPALGRKMLIWPDGQTNGDLGSAELTRQVGISEQAFYRWKKQYGGLQSDQVRELKVLQDENARLKKLVAELSLDKAILQDIHSKKWPGLR